ncbi:thioredoxin-like protein [Mycena belliarum]|uniref:glutathione transferase n=1 Tax=Mycena belliarum TaxID=1033014 RepID=A0AAD6UDZ8_9AGAR|nr:thioredoxin-like protein [Mycena belliae]
MVLKLVGAGLSTSTLRAALVLVEKKVPFDMAKGEHKAPEFVSKQSFGQVPYMIDDDGFVLYESRAICRYIEEKYAGQGTPLVPIDPKGKALFEQAASIEFANFDPFASKAVFENFKPMWGLTPDKAVFDTLIAGLSAKLEVYEIILGKQKYLAGDEITLADLFHLPYGSSRSWGFYLIKTSN